MNNCLEFSDVTFVLLYSEVGAKIGGSKWAGLKYRGR